MAKNKLEITNVTKVKQCITKIDQDMANLANEIRKLSNNVNAMMVGDMEGPYWNGNKAKKFYNKAITNLKHNIDDYSTARNYLNALAVGFEKAIKQDK